MQENQSFGVSLPLHNHSEHRKVEPDLVAYAQNMGFVQCVSMCVVTVSIRAHVKWPTKASEGS